MCDHLGFKRLTLALSAVFVALVPFTALAQEPTDAELAAANNPLADLKALNFQNYFVPTLSNVEGTSNTFWLRYAQPIGKVLLRGSLPLPTVPTIGMAPAVPGELESDATSGVGDFNIFGAYLAVQNQKANVGIGPLLVMPSATDDALGTGKWQGGVATVLFFTPNPTVQYGGLITWQASFAGDEERDDTNVVVGQPFFFFQLGGGTYLRSAPQWVFNIEQDTYNVPFGFGIGKVIRSGNTTFNIFIEPQFTILHKGAGQPMFQVFSALNLQFF